MGLLVDVSVLAIKQVPFILARILHGQSALRIMAAAPTEVDYAEINSGGCESLKHCRDSYPMFQWLSSYEGGRMI